MIINLERTADYISNWIKDYAIAAGKKSLVFGLSGGVDSALVALLCKRTGLNIVAISMPCYSSDASIKQAADLAKDFEFRLHKISLNASYDSIIYQARMNLIEENKVHSGGLKSCLRTPVLSYLAATNNGLIVGTGNRSEDNLIRYYQKFGDGCVDISPITDLYKSEVYDLFNFLGSKNGKMLPSVEAIYKAVPTADLWEGGEQTDEKELGISYDEIEWADKEEVNYGSVTCEDPAKHDRWVTYSGRQKTVIAKISHMEKISRHKVNPNLPICKLRHRADLVL